MSLRTAVNTLSSGSCSATQGCVDAECQKPPELTTFRDVIELNGSGLLKLWHLWGLWVTIGWARWAEDWKAFSWWNLLQKLVPIRQCLSRFSATTRRQAFVICLWPPFLLIWLRYRIHKYAGWPSELSPAFFSLCTFPNFTLSDFEE